MDTVKIIQILQLSSFLVSAIGEFSNNVEEFSRNLDIPKEEKEKIRNERIKLHEEIKKINIGE